LLEKLEYMGRILGPVEKNIDKMYPYFDYYEEKEPKL